MDIFTVAFFGHRFIDNPFRVEGRLEEHIYRLLSEKEYVNFLVGRDGVFDQFVSSTVLRVRKRYKDDNSSPIVRAYEKSKVLVFIGYYMVKITVYKKTKRSTNKQLVLLYLLT